ncbi:universal stress protein [Oceanibacterium hippocampi]|uniref:Stress response protein NhaX n=1 Tax=Oceanibacterium hippocampi TaxID=745714 RepID=A0A1Y5TE84_9PROT|nr:universal stress protein [Oceanibacterium hippocampi]SLN58422.1 Stress response protein NhaX [Oceanibacterium hippocampi]
MFAHILCAIDGSEHARKAATVATDLAVRHGSRLTFITITRELALTGELKRYVEIENQSRTPQYILDERTEKTLEDAARGAREAGVAKIRTAVMTGKPARDIVAYADHHDVDLTVLGARGLGELEALLLGSVAHKVASLAKNSVLVVR